jgi:Uma2 family endonuclease
MTEALPKRLTADAFIAWAMTRQGRFELEAGEVVAMAPERLAHARIKGNVYLALRAALAGRSGCEALPDGAAVRIDNATVYEPDALVRCGEPLPGDVLFVPDPVVVVEVLSPSTQGADTGAKLEGYFRLPSLRHYLIVKPASRAVIHHGRGETGGIATSILHEGEIELDPPGIILAVAALFGG